MKKKLKKVILYLLPSSISIISIIIFPLLILFLLSLVVGTIIAADDEQGSSSISSSGTSSISNQIEGMVYYSTYYKTVLNNHLTSTSSSSSKGYVSLQRTQMFYEMLMNEKYGDGTDFVDENGFRSASISTSANTNICPDGIACNSRQLSYAYAIYNGVSDAQATFVKAYEMNLDSDGNMLGLADACKKLDSEGYYCTEEKQNELESNGYDSISKLKTFLSFPLDYSSDWQISSLFNIYRIINGKSNLHSGWDIPRSAKTPIYSVCSGEVISVSYKYKSNISGGDGNYIKVLCDESITVGSEEVQIEIWYWHLYPETNPYVSVGDKVSQGQKIARVGTTGNSTGNHLHISMANHSTGVKMDILLYINWSEYIEGSTTKTSEEDTDEVD